MKEKSRPIDLLIQANRNRQKYVRFDIPIDEENSLEAIMNAPDIFLIMEEQEIVYRKAYAQCCEEGLDKYPIDEDEWEKELQESLRIQREAAMKAGREFNEKDAYERLLRDKPANAAQQVARKISKFRTISEILPKVIKCADGKTKMFPSQEERNLFRELICSDMKLFTYLSEKYIELINSMTEEEAVAKNSLEEESSKNGDSKRSLQGDTQATEVHLTEN